MWTASRCRRCSAWSPTWMIGSSTRRARSPPRISGAGTGRRPRCARPSPGSAAQAPRPGRSSRSHCPDMIRQGARSDHRHRTRPRCRPRSGPGPPPGPQGTPRAGQAVHPRQISFTAARRAAITATRNGAATASLPSPLTAATRDAILRQDLGRRHVTVDRDRHRDHKTKAWQVFPAAGRGITTRKAPATITVCGPISPPEPSPRPHPRRQLPPPARGTGRQPGATSRSHPCAANTITVRSSPRRAPPNASQTRNRSSTWHARTSRAWAC